MVSQPSATGLQVLPSILSANFVELGTELAALVEAGADAIHLDVMDGHFVPNISFGAGIVAALRPLTTLPFDVHLMIAPTDPYLEGFAAAGATSIIVHAEAGPHLQRTVQTIRKLGCSPGVALNPATPVECLEWVLDDIDIVLVMSVNPGFGGQAFLPASVAKIRRIETLCAGRGIAIEVDGGVDAATAGDVAAAGASRLVAGSAVFRGGRTRYRANVDAIRHAALRARGELV